MLRKLSTLVCVVTFASCGTVDNHDYSKPFLYKNQIDQTAGADESTYAVEKRNCNVKTYVTCGPLVAKKVGAKLFWNSSSGVPPTATTVVYVLLAPDGNVMQVKVDKSSGFPAYDQDVIRAVNAASPLPASPDPFQRRLHLTVVATDPGHGP